MDWDQELSTRQLVGLGLVLLIGFLLYQQGYFGQIFGQILNYPNVRPCFDTKMDGGNLVCGGKRAFELGRRENWARLERMTGVEIYREVYGEPPEADLSGGKLSEQGKNKVEASFVRCDLRFDVGKDYEHRYGKTYETTTNNSRLAFKNERKEHYFAYCSYDGAPKIEYDSQKIKLIIDKDRDDDRVYNYEDDCPNEYGEKANGCPKIEDADGDGIPDDQDACRLEPGVEKYNGCPPPEEEKPKPKPKPKKKLPIPLIAIGVVIAVLLGVAYWVWRRY